MLRSPGLNTGSHVTTHQAKRNWIHEQPFTLYGNAWRWVYSIANKVIRGAFAIHLVAQKIRSLNALSKSAEEISNMLKKDVVHLGLNKKNIKELRAVLDGYIKAVSFTIHFHCFSFHKLLNLFNKVKFDKHVV